MTKQEFQILLQEKQNSIERMLGEYLVEETGYQKTVLEAMNYSLMAGGKRLRPILMQEVYHMCGGKGKMIEPFMVAIEMIHSYSLVHDDLPAMDNDEYRRGRKTTWSVYGENMGILAGDGLLTYAFEVVMQAFQAIPMDEGREIWTRVSRATAVLARKAGVYGMIGGQTLDIEAEEQQEPIKEEQLLFIHEYKTAALIQASMMIGAILAGADETQVEAIEKCAYNIGIAFQIQDDILDVIGDSQELGKPVGSDAGNHKQTYVTLHGIEQSKLDVERLSNEAVNILNGFTQEHEFLEKLIMVLIHRRK